MRARWVRIAAALIISAALVSGLNHAVNAQQEKVITIRLSWKAKGEFAPLFVAAQKGFYERHGVSARVLEGTGAGPTLTALSNGNDQFAYVGAIETAQGVAQGMPIVMVANYIHRSPMVLASFEPLRTPRDLEGKSIGTSPQDTFQRIWEAFARANDVDTSKVRMINLDPSARLTQFLQGRVNVLSAFYTNEIPIIYERSPRPLHILWIADYGFNLLGHGLVTTRKFADQHPQVVKAIVAGTTDGFEYTLSHPAEAADIITKLFPEALDRETALLQISSMLQLLHTKTASGHPLGWNAEDEWRRTIAILSHAGLVSGATAVSVYYTNRYVGQ